MESVNQVVLHDINKSLIFRVIQEFSPISRSEIVEKTGLASSTVSVITNELQKKSLVRVCGRATSTGGRRPVLLEVNSEGGYFICADLSGENLTIGVVNLSFQVIRIWNYPISNQQSSSLLKFLIKVINEIRQWCTGLQCTVIGIGIATPGLIDPSTGTVIGADNLAWYDLDLKKQLENKFHCQVVVENDTNAAAFGEFKYGHGKNQKVNNMMYLTVSTGIGAGLILNGSLFDGSTGMAGEIGHVVVDMNGEVCVCGNRGCVETIASSSSIVRAYKKMARLEDDRQIDIQSLIQRADAGDETARQVIKTAGTAIGLAVGGQVNVLNFDLVIFGGIVEQGKIFYRSIVDGVNQALLPKLRGRLEMGITSLGQSAGIVGVALLSMESAIRALTA